MQKKIPLCNKITSINNYNKITSINNNIIKTEKIIFTDVCSGILLLILYLFGKKIKKQIIINNLKKIH